MESWIIRSPPSPCHLRFRNRFRPSPGTEGTCVRLFSRRGWGASRPTEAAASAPPTFKTKLKAIFIANPLPRTALAAGRAVLSVGWGMAFCLSVAPLISRAAAGSAAIEGSVSENAERAEGTDSLSPAMELPDGDIHSAGYAARLEAAPGEIVLTRSDWEGRAISLADLIAEQSGVGTRKYGGVGSYQSVSVRGSKAARLQVWLDGLPLHSASGSAVDLGKIGLDGLERITLRKGLLPGEDGGLDQGGSIRLESRAAAAQGGVQATAGLGSHGHRRQALAAQAQSLAGTRVSVFGALESAENDFPYKDRNHTPYNPEDDRMVRRRNSAFASADLSAALSRPDLPGAPFHWSAQLSHSQNAGGLPGDEGQTTVGAGFAGRRTGMQWRGAWRPQGAEGGEAELFLGSLREESGLHFSAEDGLSWTFAGDSVDIRNRGEKLLARLSWRSADAPDQAFAWETHGGAIRETLSPLVSEEAGNRNPRWENARSAWQGQAQGSWRFAPGWTGALSLAGEWQDDFSEGGAALYGETFEPRAESDWLWGAQASLAWSGSRRGLPVSAFLRGGRFTTAPSLNDRFGGRYGVLPNPDLRPERGWTSEAVGRWAVRLASAEVTAYWTRAEDLLLPVSSAGFLKPVNLDAARTVGLESAFHFGLGNGPQAHVQLGWRESRNLSDTYYGGNALPDAPVWEADAKLLSPRWRGFRLEPLYRFRSGLFRDPGNVRLLPPLHLFHLHGSWSRNTLSLHLWLENLGDAFYEDAYESFPAPGRQAHFTLEWAL